MGKALLIVLCYLFEITFACVQFKNGGCTDCSVPFIFSNMRWIIDGVLSCGIYVCLLCICHAMMYSTDSCFMAMFRCLYPKRWLSHAVLCVLRGSNVYRSSLTIRVGVLKRFMLFKCRMFRVLSSVARIVCVRLRSVDLNVIIFWRYARLLVSYMNEYAKCTKVTSHYAIFIFDTILDAMWNAAIICFLILSVGC